MTGNPMEILGKYTNKQFTEIKWLICKNNNENIDNNSDR